MSAASTFVDPLQRAELGAGSAGGGGGTFGHPGSDWRGVEVIADWSATERSLGALTLPVLLLAAEHDFVTLRSMEGWKHLTQQRLVVLPGAAHHALLEMPEAYGACLESFLQDQEVLVNCSRL